MNYTSVQPLVVSNHQTHDQECQAYDITGIKPKQKARTSNASAEVKLYSILKTFKEGFKIH